MKKALLALAAASAVALPLAASAQLTANVTLTSNYKFRGQDQDLARSKGFKPAIQGGFDYAFADTGFYVGNWNSSVDFAAGNSIESDFYGGYKMTTGDFALDFGALAYVYSGFAPAKTVELYASAGWGPLVLKYSHTVSDDYFNYGGSHFGSGRDGTNTGYLNLAYAQEIYPATTLKASIGYTRFSSDIHDSNAAAGYGGIPNYVDYSVGAAYDFGGGVSLGGAIVGANKRSFFGFANKNRFIVSLTKAM